MKTMTVESLMEELNKLPYDANVAVELITEDEYIEEIEELSQHKSEYVHDQLYKIWKNDRYERTAFEQFADSMNVEVYNLMRREIENTAQNIDRLIETEED